jgi:hypothetical protein
MRFAFALLVYLLMGLLLVWGILLAVKGSFWLLIAAALAYLVALARIGCITH